MEGFQLPEYLVVTQKNVTLTLDGKEYTFKKPSALKLIDIHEDGSKIDANKEIKKLVEFQIKALIDLGLDASIANELDLGTLKSCFMALSVDSSKKK